MLQQPNQMESFNYSNLAYQLIKQEIFANLIFKAMDNQPKISLVHFILNQQMILIHAANLIQL